MSGNSILLWTRFEKTEVHNYEGYLGSLRPWLNTRQVYCSCCYTSHGVGCARWLYWKRMNVFSGGNGRRKNFGKQNSPPYFRQRNHHTGAMEIYDIVRSAGSVWLHVMYSRTVTVILYGCETSQENKIHWCLGTEWWRGYLELDNEYAYWEVAENSVMMSYINLSDSAVIIK
jgi:hypothetical protein